MSNPALMKEKDMAQGGALASSFVPPPPRDDPYTLGGVQSGDPGIEQAPGSFVPGFEPVVSDPNAVAPDPNKPSADPAPEVKPDPAPAAPTVELLFAGQKIGADVAQARLAEYEKLSPLVTKAQEAGWNTEEIFKSGLAYAASDVAFTESPEAAQSIIASIIETAMQVHGEKFVMPEVAALSLDPENLDANAKVIYAQNKRMEARVRQLENAITQDFVPKIKELNDRLENRAAAQSDLAKLHAAHPETVGNIDDAALSAMKAESGVADPVAAYRFVNYGKAPSDGGAKAVKGTETKGAGGTATGGGNPALSIPDAPKNGSPATVELDPFAPDTTADMVIQAALTGRPIKGGIPERFMRRA